MDQISIVQEQEGLDFNQAIEWLMDFFQLGRHRGFGRPKKIEHKPREIKQKEIDVTEQLPQYNESILNTFYDIPIDDWMEEGISAETLKQFGIKFDISSNSIVVPCYDMNDRLVGIRVRNLSEENIERYGKYVPLTDSLSGITYKFPTGKVLYGLNQNKEKIIESKQCVIFEGEKSVLKTKTWFKDNDISVASYGCNLTNFQIELIKSLGVETLIFMWDRELDEKILKKMEKTYKKCSLLFDVYYINDYEDLLDLKESPSDKGEETYRKLLNNIVKYNLEI
jgi:DNA primase